jgi:hypothetical protein
MRSSSWVSIGRVIRCTAPALPRLHEVCVEATLFVRLDECRACSQQSVSNQLPRQDAGDPETDRVRGETPFLTRRDHHQPVLLRRIGWCVAMGGERAMELVARPPSREFC